MWTQTDDEFKKAHFDELYKLFKDIPNEGVKLTEFKRNQKKVVKLIVKNKFEELKQRDTLYNLSLWTKIRRNLIQIRWNKKDKFVRLFGKVLIEK